MNICAACREHIELRMDGMLDPAHLAQLDRHLSQCAACRQYDAAQRALTGDLAALSSVADFLASSPRREVRTAPRWMHACKIAAAVAFAVVCTWTFIRLPSKEPDIASSPVGVEIPHDEREMNPPFRFAVSVEPVDGVRRFAIPMETENPRVHMVWLYDDALMANDPAPASAPSS